MFILLAPLTCLLATAVGTRELLGRWPTATLVFSRRGALAMAAALLLALAGSTAAAVLPLWLLATLAGLLVAIAWLDLRTGMLADLLTALLGLLALLCLTLQYGSDWPNNWNACLPQLTVGIGLLALGWFFAGPYSRWRGRDMLGWGDVKFFCAAGLWLAPLQLPIFLLLAGGVGTLVALGFKLRTGQAETPFAPALCVALFACVAFRLSL